MSMIDINVKNAEFFNTAAAEEIKSYGFEVARNSHLARFYCTGLTIEVELEDIDFVSLSNHFAVVIEDVVVYIERKGR